MSLNNLYERLGIPRNASSHEVQQAYRDAARRLHPDVNIEPGATEHFINIKEAYEILSNPHSRAAYDKNAQSPEKRVHPVRIDIQYSRPAMQYSSEDQIIYALVHMDILPDSVPLEEPPPPLNVALILDTSTSMKGARLDIVKATAIELIRQFRPQDFVSIIAFDDRAEVALSAGSHINVRKAESRIHALRASGGTEIFKGLEEGYQQVQRHYQATHINHIILITDGHTYGDESACLKLADQAANQDIGLSSLGIGGKWNDILLDDLASRTGGNCLYVRNPQDIRNLLTQKLERLGQTYVERSALNFQLGPNIHLSYAFRLKPEVGILPTHTPLKVGSLPKRGHQRILLEFIVEPLPKGIHQALLMDGEFTFSIPAKSASYQIPLNLVLPVQDKVPIGTPSHLITKALSKLTLYRMQEKAQDELSEGDYNSARKRLKNIATHLLSQGQIALATTILREADHIQTSQQLSEEGKKHIKYGTRSLLLPDGNNQDYET